jgi:glycosyltransferase involved in cell wall biosynthesis
MKITLLVSDFSTNCLGRAYILAKMLEFEFEVEVIGPLFGEKVWPPCDTKEIVYKPVSCRPIFPHFFNSMKKIENLISGDIIYASKPWFSSFGVGILSKVTGHRPLILDIDDWELGWFLPYRFRKMASLSVKTILEVNGFLNTLCMERVTFIADGITTASRFLQNRFGGEYVPHARDTELFDPSRYDGEKVKRELGLKDEKIIMFLGSPKPHKGIEDLFAATRSLKRKDVRLLIIGASNGYPSNNHSLDGVDHLIIVRGMVPFMRIPEYLACSDLVVVPQNNVPSNHAQVPAKLFDAMAMAKPIISTRISDMPEILRDCGFIVDPDNPKDLVEKIDYILTNPDKTKEIGQQAREQCVQMYSLKVVGERLIKYIQEAIK